jgi:hypothetical protein
MPIYHIVTIAPIKPIMPGNGPGGRPMREGHAVRNHFVLSASALLLLAAWVEAAQMCDHCGCQRNCKKICRLVCGKKKETKTVYMCECEDFCVPGHSKKCGVKIECDCDGRHRTIIWQPTCARVRTRKKLVKDEVSKEVPDYKWVVEEYCCVCGHSSNQRRLT